MSPSFGSERGSVQNPLIRYAAEIGWTALSRDDAEDRRGGETGLFLYDTLRDKLLALNPETLDAGLAGEVIKRVQGVHPSIGGNEEILHWLRGEKSIYHPVHKREFDINLIDFDQPDNNIFEVTDEWQYTNGRHTNRADVVFLINGVPVVTVETKAAHRAEGIAEGRLLHSSCPRRASLLVTSFTLNSVHFVKAIIARKIPQRSSAVRDRNWHHRFVLGLTQESHAAALLDDLRPEARSGGAGAVNVLSGDERQHQ